MTSFSYFCPNCCKSIEVFPVDLSYQIVTINPTTLYKEGISEIICVNCSHVFYMSLPKD